jgi:hypothetical protein
VRIRPLSLLGLPLLWSLPLLWAAGCGPFIQVGSPEHPLLQFGPSVAPSGTTALESGVALDDDGSIDWTDLLLGLGATTLASVLGGAGLYSGILRPRRIARESRPNGNGVT